MSNLLPIRTEHDLIRTYRARFLLMASLLLLLMGIIAGVILLPSYIIIKKDQMSLASSALPSVPAANAQDRALVTHIQSRLKELAPFVASTSRPSNVIVAALAPRPSSVFVNHITYTKGKMLTIVLSGQSDYVEEISDYQEGLATSTRFTGVSVPVGALAGINNGNFNITVIGNL